MTRKNRYANRARISTWQLVRYFVLDLTASQLALLTGLNRDTINQYLRALRERIAEFCEAQSPFGGEIEGDESYLGARRIKGKRGCGAYSKTIVLESFNAMGTSTPNSFLTAGNPRCKRLFAVRFPWTV